MKIRHLVVTALALLLVAPITAQARKFTNFDVPGAAETLPGAINDNNEITGYYETDTFHGFVRTSDGTISTFDPPGSVYTIPVEINRSGEVIGSFCDASNIEHGFVREPNGSIMVFDVRNSAGTSGAAINDKSSIGGSFLDSNLAAHGFLRKPTGKVISFDPAGSVSTFSSDINNDRTITGYYCTMSPCLQNAIGFLRMPTGEIVSFSIQDAQATIPVRINSKGWLGGIYNEFSGPKIGFIRTPDGGITKLQIGSGNTYVVGLNNNNWAAGSYQVSGVNHGFVRRPDGTIVKFDDPDAGNDTSEGTQPGSINNGRYVTGNYEDSNRQYHGFLVRLR